MYAPKSDAVRPKAATRARGAKPQQRICFAQHTMTRNHQQHAVPYRGPHGRHRLAAARPTPAYPTDSHESGTSPNGNWERKTGVRRAPLANNGRQPCSHPHMECIHTASAGGAHWGKSNDVGALRCVLRPREGGPKNKNSTRRTGANNGRGGTPRRRTQQRHPAAPGESSRKPHRAKPQRQATNEGLSKYGNAYCRAMPDPKA